MKILVGMHHPKHYWMFRNIIHEGRKRGWQIEILIKDKDILEKLLITEGWTYHVIGTDRPTRISKLIGLVGWVSKTLNHSRYFQPDILIGRALPEFAFVSFFRRSPFIVYEDSEPAIWIHRLISPCTSIIITPLNFSLDLGKNQFRINSYDELNYLHPHWFTPDASVLERYNMSPDEKYAVLRFVSWEAYHDIGKRGIDLYTQKEIVELLERRGYKVYISSESSLANELMKYKLNINPHDIHHILSFASIYVGDSQTMATEAALLGTPSIRCNSFVGKDDMSNFLELEHRYNLLYNLNNERDLLMKLEEIVDLPDAKRLWRERRDALIEEKDDPVEIILNILDSWPDIRSHIADLLGGKRT